MMKTDIKLTSSAQSDLFTIINYLACKSGKEAANKRLLLIEAAFETLLKNTDEGARPPELHDILNAKHLEIDVADTRIIYIKKDKEIFVMALIDAKNSAPESTSLTKIEQNEAISS